MGRPLDGYPTSFGNVRGSIFPHVGPALYTQVSYGPLAGGDTVQAIEAGLKYFDRAEGGVTDSANFSVQSIPVNSSTGPVGQPSLTYRLKWTAMRTAVIGGQAQVAGSEAAAGTVLTGETLRMMAFGPK